MSCNNDCTTKYVVARDAANGPEGAGGGGGGTDLHSRFNSLYEAMQDLLGNLHLPEIPQQDGADSEDSDDEYEWQ